MKIIHTADLHLESPMAKLPITKSRERREELFETFERMALEASRIGVEVIIIAGDLFDNERFSNRAHARVISTIKRFPEVTFLYLSGNHEADAFTAKIKDMPRNLKIFDKDWTYFNFGEVTIVGRTLVSPGMFSSLEIDEKRRNIVVLHGPVVESSSDSGISLSLARARGIDYIALGHYHGYTEYKIDERGCAVYSGVPEGRGFDEVGKCGYVSLLANENGVSHHFTPFAKREVRIVDVDITECESEAEVNRMVDSSLAGIPDGDIVRLRLIGRRSPELYPDMTGIEFRHKDAFYYFEAKDDTRTKINPEDYKHDKSVLGEFIRLVYSKDDLTEDDKEAIIKCGIAAMLGDSAGI